MKSLCHYLRRSCQEHEKVANVIMLAATALFAATLTVFIFYQQAILAWVRENPILHPILLGAVVLLEVFLVFALTRMVFTDCRREAHEHGGGYVGRRSHGDSGAWIENLGVNPKRK